MKDLKKSVDILRKYLKKDKDLYYSWQSNIAMSFIDEFKRNKKPVLHKIANKAAKNFLNLLIE